MPEFSVIQTRSKLPSALIATAVLLLIALAIYLYGRNRNPQLAITQVQTYVARSELKAMKTRSKYIGSLSTIDTDLYVLVNVKLTDTTSHPLFIKDETGVLTAPDHSVLESSATLTADIPQVFNAFPDLQKLAGKPLLRDTKISPGQTVEGTVLLHYPSATEVNWNPRESATVTIDFFHNDPITLTIPK
jgi:hypothetical protein